MTNMLKMKIETNPIYQMCQSPQASELYGELKENILECYDQNKGSFDGNKLQRFLFNKESSKSIFISHSYKDVGRAIELKKQIEEKTNHTVFIDSLYWKSVYAAQKQLKQYDGDSVSKHLHIMLTTAIVTMIQSCEYFLFLESPNTLSDIQSNKITESPWIYFELQIAKILIRPQNTILAEACESRGFPDMNCHYSVKEIIEQLEEIRDLETLVRRLKNGK